MDRSKSLAVSFADRPTLAQSGEGGRLSNGYAGKNTDGHAPANLMERMEELDKNNNPGVEQKFRAAVEVIQGMPKEGPFQAPDLSKLKFYALYKQVTCGPCETPKPGFWNVVDRAKWEAWKRCGDMSKVEAMQQYIDDLKEMVVDMVKRDDVKEFMTTCDPSVFEPMLQMADLKNNHKDEQLAVDGNAHCSDVTPHVDADSSLSSCNTGGELMENSTHRDGATDNDDRTVDGDVSGSDADDAAFTDAQDMVMQPNGHGHDGPETNGDARKQTGVQQSNGQVPGTDTCRSKQKRSSARKKRAVNLMGTLLREITKENGAQPLPSPSEMELAVSNNDYYGHNGLTELCRASWESVEQLQRERRLRESLETHDELLGLSDIPPSVGSGRWTKRSRGRGDSSGNPPAGDNTTDAGAAPAAAAGLGGAGPSLHGRSAATGGDGERSSGSETASSGGDSPVLVGSTSSDRHVASVLFRMHRELQQISRQLDLLEGILITQQRLVHATLNQTVQANRSRLFFFSNLPWRTVLFIVSWPVVVHFIIRLLWFWYQRKRTLARRDISKLL